MTIRRLELTGMAVGGEAVAREESGRVVFVQGGAPGDVAQVEITETKKRYARGQVRSIETPSPLRVDPPCAHVAEGCGGCDWQHIDRAAQSRLRVESVTETLQRLGRITDPDVTVGPDVPIGVRTTVRGVADTAGRFAFRRRRSHDLVTVDDCLVAHPLVEELMADGRFAPGTQITIRVGSRTGERLVVTSGESDEVSVPEDVTVVSDAALRDGHRAWFHEDAAGRRWRVSAQSFFQASPEGAEALVATVQSLVEVHGTDGRLVDLCAGVGLFAGTIGRDRDVVAVERSASSIADARVNLADIDARILKVSMAGWRPSPAEVVVADPARSGLERSGVDAVAETGAGLCVLVSCDVGSLGRDARMLTESGYRHVSSVTLDLFPHTGQVEVVSAFVRL